MHMHITCGGCGMKWDVFQRDDWKAETARECPRCGRSINARTWEHSVLRAFGEAVDASSDLYNDSVQPQGAAFRIDYLDERFMRRRR